MKNITRMTDEEILNHLKNNRDWMDQLGYTSEEIEATGQQQISIDEWEASLGFTNDGFDGFYNETITNY